MLFLLLLVHQLKADAGSGVEQQLFAVVAAALAPQPCQKHHRELQALGAVDGHQPHTLLLEGVAGGHVLALLLQPVHIPHKGGQTTKATLLKTTGQPIQLM